jgi:hypothetical protein
VSTVGTGLLLHTDVAYLVRSAVVAIACGVAVSLLAVTVPLSRLASLAPARVMDE